MLVEVLHVQAIVNGTAVTVVGLDELKKEHRRHKREVDTETIRFRESYPMERKFSVSVQKTSLFVSELCMQATTVKGPF